MIAQSQGHTADLSLRNVPVHEVLNDIILRRVGDGVTAFVVPKAIWRAFPTPLRLRGQRAHARPEGIIELLSFREFRDDTHTGVAHMYSDVAAMFLQCGAELLKRWRGHGGHESLYRRLPLG